MSPLLLAHISLSSRMIFQNITNFDRITLWLKTFQWHRIKSKVITMTLGSPCPPLQPHSLSPSPSTCSAPATVNILLVLEHTQLICTFKIFTPAVPPAQNSPPQISNGQLLLVSQGSQLKCHLLGTLPLSSTRKSPHIQLSSYLSILFTFFLVSTNSVSPSVYLLLSFPESKMHWGGIDSCFCCFPSAGQGWYTVPQYTTTVLVVLST